MKSACESSSDDCENAVGGEDEASSIAASYSGVVAS